MFSTLITILKIVFILGFLVFIHEGGHFLVAKLCKIKVKEFAIGFGPTIWSKQGKETKYALRLIPLGGFVNMIGEEERSEEEGSFSKASIPKRIAVVAAGGLVNIIFAILVYFILMSSIGNNVSTIIDYPMEGSNAQIAGLQSGDKILKINDKTIHYKKDLDEALQKCNGGDLTVIIERNKQQQTFTFKPKEENGQYYLGIYLQRAEKSFGNNIYYAFWETGDFAFSIVDNLKMLFTGNVSVDQMMGPVGIGEVVAETSGFVDFIYILALVSISLGFTNLLPFPPLDGGKIVILLIEAVRRKPLKEKTEVTIQMVGFMLLIGLSIYVTYNDILRIF